MACGGNLPFLVLCVMVVPKIVGLVLFMNSGQWEVCIPADSWSAILSMSTCEVDYCVRCDVADDVETRREDYVCDGGLRAG